MALPTYLKISRQVYLFIYRDQGISYLLLSLLLTDNERSFRIQKYFPENV